MRHSRPLLLTAVAVAVVALVAPWAAPAYAAAPDVSVRPLPLPVGAKPTVPYVERTGDRTAEVVDTTAGTTTPVTLFDDLDEVGLVGRSGSGYVLRVTNRDFDRVVRAENGVAQRTLADLHYSSHVSLSADGSYLMDTVYPTDVGVQLQVRRATTGALVARHTFKQSTDPIPIDVSGSRVLLGGFRPARTMLWNWSTGAITTIASRAAYAGSFSDDRLAGYTKDPLEQGACSVVSTVSHPGTTLWRSCSEEVAAFSPDGARVATRAMGPGDDFTYVRRRSVHGTLLTTYRNTNGVLMYAWETATRVLLSSRPSSGADWLVRCEVATCERTVQPAR